MVKVAGGGGSGGGGGSFQILDIFLTFDFSSVMQFISKMVHHSVNVISTRL